MNNDEKFLIDTNILIDHLKGIKTDVLLRLKERGMLYVTAINYWEIYKNIRDREKLAVESLMKNLGCIPISCEIGEIAAEYYVTYKQYNLNVDDLLIAAVAKYNRMILITNNVKHFPFPDIIIENP